MTTMRIQVKHLTELRETSKSVSLPLKDPLLQADKNILSVMQDSLSVTCHY